MDGRPATRSYPHAGRSTTTSPSGPTNCPTASRASPSRPQNRERCYARTRAILTHNLPIAREWIARFGGRLTWREPQAGAIALVSYDADITSLDVAERVRVNQSTLIVPGSHVGLEGYLRIWLGGREEFLREGLRRIGDELTALFD